MKKPRTLGVYENGELVAVATSAGVMPVRDPAYIELQRLKAVTEKAASDAKLVDLFLVQFRAQMRALVASDAIDMMSLCELLADEIQKLVEEYYPHAGA